MKVVAYSDKRLRFQWIISAKAGRLGPSILRPRGIEMTTKIMALVGIGHRKTVIQESKQFLSVRIGLRISCPCMQSLRFPLAFPPNQAFRTRAQSSCGRPWEMAPLAVSTLIKSSYSDLMRIEQKKLLALAKIAHRKSNRLPVGFEHTIRFWCGPSCKELFNFAIRSGVCPATVTT